MEVEVAVAVEEKVAENTFTTQGVMVQVVLIIIYKAGFRPYTAERPLFFAFRPTSLYVHASSHMLSQAPPCNLFYWSR
jgi:hypothetical protein